MEIPKYVKCTDGKSERYTTDKIYPIKNDTIVDNSGSANGIDYGRRVDKTPTLHHLL